MAPPSFSKRAFVTVGSTKFDGLVQKALSESTLRAFRDKGFSHLVVQAGNSSLPPAWDVTKQETKKDIDGLLVTVWRFKPSLDEEMQPADLVVSHAGALLFFP